MTSFPIVTDAPVHVDPPDGLLHISASPLSDAAWAIAVSVGAVVTALCGYRRVAGPADPHRQDVCPKCDVLVRATDMEVRT